MRRVPVNGVVHTSMMFSNVIVDIAFPPRSFVFNQSSCEVSASLTDVGGMAVGTIDLISYSLFVPGFVFVLNVRQRLASCSFTSFFFCNCFQLQPIWEDYFSPCRSNEIYFIKNCDNLFSFTFTYQIPASLVLSTSTGLFGPSQFVLLLL